MTIPLNSALGTVLYVDQEETASKYIRAKFAADYDLLFAYSATQALAYLHDDTRHIDVIVTDDRLPGRTESTLLLQAIEAHPYIECILVTADAPREIVREQQNQGRPWYVLEKPVDLDEVGIAVCAAMIRSMRRQMRCQRYEAMKDTVHFLSDCVKTHHGAVKDLCEIILDPESEVPIDRFTLQQKANKVLAGSKKIRHETLLSFDSALRTTGHGIENQNTNTTAEKLIADIIVKMPLSQEELSYFALEVRNDFPIPKTAALMDLVLTNIIHVALASVRARPLPRTISITVCIEGVPQIIISDNGTGVGINGDAKLDHTEPCTSQHVTAMKICRDIMMFLGGTLLVTSYPVGESQIILEFPCIEETIAD